MDFDEKKEPNKKISRKGKKPTRFKPGAKTLETEKSKGKKIALETDSDVPQNNSGEEQLVIKKTVLESTSRSVKTLETEKSKGKRIAIETDSDHVQQKKKNIYRETPLVIKEPVPENLPINDRKDKPDQSVKNPAACFCFGLEDCVKSLRQLEASKHIDKGFRQSFLTWYSLRANPEQTKIVRAFIHAFKDDLEALAEQLIDAFSEFISKKRSPTGDGDGASSSGVFKKPRIN